MWATNDPNARFWFADNAPIAQATQERRIKRLALLASLLLPVTIGLHFLLPPTPLALVFVGLLWGFGASIPIGILLALWTERRRTARPRTTIQVSGAPAHNGALFMYVDGTLEFRDNQELFLYGLPAPQDEPVTP